MTAKELGSKPIHYNLFTEGLTKRELFAGSAMLKILDKSFDDGILRRSFDDRRTEDEYKIRDIAKWAVYCSDELLTELAKT